MKWASRNFYGYPRKREEEKKKKKKKKMKKKKESRIAASDSYRCR
jgi:hypothetical protein